MATTYSDTTQRVIDTGTKIASASQAAITMSATSTTTQLRTDVNKCATLLNRIRADLITQSAIKGSS